MTDCRMADTRNKEVISIKDGTRPGVINDIEIELKTVRINTIITYGRLEWLDSLSREDDTVTRRENVQIIGEGTVLVSLSVPFRPKKRFGSDRFHT